MPSLHFSLGDNLGIILQNIAHEHLFYDMDPDWAIRTLVDSGCPKKYALDILQNKLYLDVLNDTEMCIRTSEEISTEKLEQYHEFDPNFIENTLHKRGVDLIEGGEYFIKHAYQFFSGNLIYTIKYEHAQDIFDMPKEWDWSVHTHLTPLEIAEIWMNNDKKLIKLLEEGEITKCFTRQVSDIFQELNGIKQYIQEGMKLINLNEWLQKNLSCPKPSDFDTYVGIIQSLVQLMSLLKEMDESSIKIWTELHKETNRVADIAIVNKSGGDNFAKLKEFIEAQKSDRDISKPVTWNKNWTAGFIDREGHVYGMMEEESRLAHMDLADAIYEANPDLPILENNRDWSLDRLGWVRFHSGALRYSGYSITQFTNAVRNLPITSRQKDKLEEYARKYYPHGLYNEGPGDSHIMITADMWKDITDEKLEKIFEF